MSRRPLALAHDTEKIVMEIILLERVGRLGNIGDKVTVKNGYARNFLLPRNKAVRATKANLEQFEAQRAALEAQNAEKRATAQQDAKKFEGVSLTLIRPASEDGKLYGSVNVRDVQEALAAKGLEVSRLQVVIRNPIKNAGSYKVGVQLHPEVVVDVTVTVARNEASAAAEAKAEAEAEAAEAAAAAAAAANSEEEAA
jgi:large subunit ribosomal protein L9